MFGFWLPIGLLIASIALFAVAIAKRHKHVTVETYRLTAVIWSTAAIVLSVGIGWSSYQMEPTLRRFESMEASAHVLQEHIKAIEAERQLMHFADPLQGENPVALQKNREVLRNKASSIREESEALMQDLASARSQFDEFNQIRMRRDFTLFLCALGFALALTTAAVCRDAIRTRHR